MVELTNAEIDTALARGETAWTTEPSAAKARYGRKLARVVVELTNGCAFAFPPRLAQGLATATDDELAGVEIVMHGYGLHWESLEVDFSIPRPLAGIFGTRS